MQYLFQVPQMAFFDCSGVRIMLTLPEDESQSSQASVLYMAEDGVFVSSSGTKVEGAVDLLLAPGG